MYVRDTDWNTYLVQRNHANQDIINALGLQTHEQTRAIARGQAAQLRAQGITHQTLQRGFGSLIANQVVMNSILQNGFSAMVEGLAAVHMSIESLHADFNLAMGEILWKLETQNQTLQSILETLQAPLDTAAKELRKRAEDSYRNGWYDEALRDFLESEQKNYQDFAVHQAIGNIYLFCRQPATFGKALEYYLKAGKYAEPRSPYYAALGYMYAGFVYYLQRDDQKAIRCAQRATQMGSDFPEAWYTLAKFAAAARQPAIAIPALERAICAERTYALKARADADFNQIEPEVTALMQRLYTEAQYEAHTQWKAFQQNMSIRWYPGLHDPVHIPDLLQQKTYFDYREALQCLEECYALFAHSHADTILRGHSGALYLGMIYHIEWSPNSDFLISSGSDDQSLQWRISDGECTNTFAGRGFFAYNPNRNAHVYAACCVKAAKLSGGVQFEVFAENTSTTLEPPVKGSVSSSLMYSKCVFSPDGKMVAGSVPDKIVVWKVTNKQKFLEIKLPKGMWVSPILNAICFSPDSQQIVGGATDNTIYIWNVDSGQKQTNLKGHQGVISAVTFSPDGTLLASSSFDQTIILWEYATGRTCATLRGHTDKVLSVAFHPSGKYLASGSKDNTIRIWNMDTLTQISIIHGHTDNINAVAFSPDGSLLASGGTDKTARLWRFAAPI